MRAWLERVWYGQAAGGGVLVPLAALFGLVVRLRRLAYRRGWLASGHPGRPVVVVGNLTVGGSGKTPLTAWLATALGARGFTVGIASRGHGGSALGPVEVTAASDPRARRRRAGAARAPHRRPRRGRARPAAAAARSSRPTST